ncbi:hypothetical protein RHMOL_Rhmol05G0031500 [Rhododendron molle]|uniref:Uncharacterized protein n=1 Tax=Rhododendron molle TaxID=49168 RepID=A0ACC0NKW8_RHOML|nr:hypothetical protein RHMOL_Rhmol05G0031500 [Rhododendron molle]
MVIFWFWVRVIYTISPGFTTTLAPARHQSGERFGFTLPLSLLLDFRLAKGSERDTVKTVLFVGTKQCKNHKLSLVGIKWKLAFVISEKNKVSSFKDKKKTSCSSCSAEGNDNELPDFCEFFKKSHTLKKTKEWIKPTCAVLHAAMEKARDEALKSGVSLTHEEFSTKVLGKGKNPKYLRGLGVGPTPTSLSFKSHLESRAHAELLSIRSEMELLREEQRRKREEYQREREERERERQEERDRLAKLESLVTKFLDTHGTPWVLGHNLRKLVLKNAWLSADGFNVMPALTDLTLEFIRLDDEDLSKVNSCFPSLQVLNLMGVGGLKEPKIHLLRLRECRWTVFNAPLSLTILAPNLIKLKLECIKPGSLFIDAPLLSDFHLSIERACNLVVKDFRDLKTLHVESPYLRTLLGQFRHGRSIKNLTVYISKWAESAEMANFNLERLLVAFPNAQSVTLGPGFWLEAGSCIHRGGSEVSVVGTK